MKNLSKIIKTLLIVSILIFANSCTKEELKGSNISQLLHLKHKGASMPILVEGNIDSDVIVLWVHGGPGYSARIYNTNVTKFTDLLEEKYAVAYWDQRKAGDSKANNTSPDLSLELMTEDLDKVVELLKFKFGNNKKIFLFGHSWGGLLSANYLVNKENQNEIAGWIEIGGSHDNPRADSDVFNLINTVANQQITNNISKEKWQNILNSLEKIDSANMNFEQLDNLMNVGFQASMLATDDGLTNRASLFDFTTIEELYSYMFYDQSIYASRSNFSQIESEQFYANVHPKLSITNLLHKIYIPSLVMYGKYDFIVPPGQGEEAYELISTPEEDKYYILYERSGHYPFDSEVDLFLEDLKRFIEKYK